MIHRIVGRALRGFALSSFTCLAIAALSASTAHAVPEANTCVAGKIGCVAKEVAGLLKCQADARKKATEPDSECIAKVSAKLYGTPEKPGCFAKVEAKQDPAKPATLCRSEDDETAFDLLTRAVAEDTACVFDPLACAQGSCAASVCTEGAARNASCSPCVEEICGEPFFAHCCATAWDADCVEAAEAFCNADCGSSTGEASTCSSGKIKCLSKRIKADLGCYKKAQQKGVAVDPECLAKADAAYDGNGDPAKGCFAKLEAKQDPTKPASMCFATGDSDSRAADADYSADTLACALEVDTCPCCDGRCLDLVEDPADVVVDGTTHVACSPTCRYKTPDSAQCGTCSNCEAGEICVDGQCKCEVGTELFCQEVAPVPNCTIVSAASGNPSCGFLRNSNGVVESDPTTYGPGTHGNWFDHFYDVEGYQDQPVFIHIGGPGRNAMTLDGSGDSTAIVFACEDGNGQFRTHDDDTIRNYFNADGVVSNEAAFLGELTTALTCKSFVDGPVYRGLPPADPFTWPDKQGDYILFQPAPGETGRYYSQVAVLIDDSSSRTAMQGSVPFHVLWFNIHINPGSPP